jgi:hypothetical protein
MTQRLRFGGRPSGWPLWLAALAVLLALLPPLAGACQTGRRGCPMARQAKACGCCCGVSPHAGRHLGGVPCGAVQAPPAAPAVLSRSEDLAADPVSFTIVSVLPAAPVDLAPRTAGWSIPPDTAPPPGPARSTTSSRAPPALLS